MGQKSNPNSFNKNKAIFFSNTSLNFREYSKIFLINHNLNLTFKSVFEKKGCLLKNFNLIFDSKRNALIIYISVFVLKTGQNTGSHQSDSLNLSKFAPLLKKKIFDIFDSYGLEYKKRFVFQNLNKTFEKQKINNLVFRRFQNELYFIPALNLIKILLTSLNNSQLLAKFVVKFFKLFYKTKKLNKFFLFLGILQRFVVSHSKLTTGIKIQLKGRLRGAPRSKIRLINYGVIALQTVDTLVSYSLVHAHTSHGTFGIRVWISYKNKT